jgi:hypothetical protein
MYHICKYFLQICINSFYNKKFINKNNTSKIMQYGSINIQISVINNYYIPYLSKVFIIRRKLSTTQPIPNNPNVQIYNMPVTVLFV